MAPSANLKPTPKKALLCLHGAGSSGPIFKIQLARIRLALKHDYDFVFATAPNPSIAGPGMQLFAGAGPFYRWFSPDTGAGETGISSLHASVRSAVEVWEAGKKDPEAEIVGVVGFSQGAVAATLLMWQQQGGEIPWLSKLQFGVFICSDLTEEVTRWLDEEAVKRGEEKAVLRQPTLHLHGLKDPYLAKGRRMMAGHYDEASMVKIEFDGGHHCPNTPLDSGKAIAGIRQSASGISFKSQFAYLLVYVTRYLDLLWTNPFASGLGLYNTVFKILFISAQVYIVYLMLNDYKPTHDPNADTFKVEYLLAGAAVMGLVFPPEYKFTEMLWAFSLWLESVAILPQLFMLQRTGSAETITTHYIFALGAYRALYIPNWIWRYFMEKGHFEPIPVIAGIIQTVLYTDFFYIYWSKVMQGQRFNLPV
nr:hypothetical protein B0A51_00199 [Rachicladosporium sp. CCFEE 5018]